MTFVVEVEVSESREIVVVSDEKEGRKKGKAE